MAIRPQRPVGLLLNDARRELAMTQSEFGYAVGASHRSAVRWDAGQAVPGESHLRKLAELLVPLNRALAEEAASHLGETLVDLGLVEPPRPPPAPPAPPPPPPPTPAEDLVDVVVCAVAELCQTVPSAQRLVLYTAFKRAREVGLSVEAAERALAPKTPPRPPSPGEPGEGDPSRSARSEGKKRGR